MFEFKSFSMTTVERKEQIATRDGDATRWLEYVKRVRLQYERTEPRKRNLLGAELASRLSGKAWDIVSADIDHDKLQRSDGAAYLLRFLEDRLCKTPVPDLGQRLEEFFMRIRRTPGSSMTEWATALRESYRRLQRAMTRQRQQTQGVARSDVGSVRAASNPTSPARRSSPSTSRGFMSPASPAGGAFPDDVPEERPSPSQPVRPDGPEADGDEPTPADGPEQWQRTTWSEDEWRQWRQGQWQWRSEWQDHEEQEPIRWEQFEYDEQPILPNEILGWLLLRRSGLPPSARLSVLSAINNRLDLETMERAMRDQEEELLLSEAHRERHEQFARPRRSFWVEQDSQWGLVQEPEMDDLDESSIFWVGKTLPPEIYPEPGAEPHETTWCTWTSDGQELHWSWQDDDFYAMDADGVFWSWTETKDWQDAEECAQLSPQDGNEVMLAYANFQDKIRTFRESRQLNYAKQHSRGYYPLGMLKGKTKKGKGNQKGKSKAPPQSAALANFTKGKGGSGGSGTQRPGHPEYRGCFICGSKDHDFRACPERGSPGGASSGKGMLAHSVFMVSAVVDTESDLRRDHVCDDGTPCTDEALGSVEDTSRDLVGAGALSGRNDEISAMVVVPVEDEPEGNHLFPAEKAAALATLASEYPGHAVLDSGATDTLASLEALHDLMSLRQQVYGAEEVTVLEGKKRFRFGNGETQSSTSYVEVPQVVNGQGIRLGIHAIDAPGVPILLSVKTLKKLEAVIDFKRCCMVMKAFSTTRWIPLKQGANDHLLLDLTRDWYEANTAVPVLLSETDYKVRSGELGGVSAVEGLEDEELIPAEPAGPSMRFPAIVTLAAASCALSGETNAATFESDGVGRGGPCHRADGIYGAGSGQVQGEVQVEEGPDSQPPSLRLQSGGGARSPRSAEPGFPLLRSARGDARRPWLALGAQQACEVGGVPEVPHPPGVRPYFRGAGHLPLGRTPATGCAYGSRADQGAAVRAGGPGEFEHAPDGRPGGRGLSPDQAEGAGGAEGEVPAQATPGGRQARGEHYEGGCGVATREEHPGPCVPGCEPGAGGGRGRELMESGGVGDGLSPSTEPLRPLSGSETQRLVNHAEEYAREAHAAFRDLLPAASEVALMEVCCPPDSQLSETFLRHGLTTIRLGLPATDLSTKAGLAEVLMMVDKWRPSFMWLSLPCGPFSPLSEPLSEAQWAQSQARQRKARRLIRHGLAVARRQLLFGGSLHGSGRAPTVPGICPRFATFGMSCGPPDTYILFESMAAPLVSSTSRRNLLGNLGR